MCSLSKDISVISREIIQNAFFFQDYAPFPTLTFYPKSSTPSRALAPALGALVLCPCLFCDDVDLLHVAYKIYPSSI